MKIRMLKMMAGPQGVQHIGDEWDAPQATALELLRSGAAEAAERAQDIERAVIEPKEQAVTPRRRGRPRKLPA